jgi:hypothetical protein
MGSSGSGIDDDDLFATAQEQAGIDEAQVGSVYEISGAGRITLTGRSIGEEVRGRARGLAVPDNRAFDVAGPEGEVSRHSVSPVSAQTAARSP